MTDGPTTGDREQQRNDNVASRRQSGLEPLPRDREEREADSREDEVRRAAEGEDEADDLGA